MTPRPPLLIVAAVPSELGILNRSISEDRIVRRGPVEFHSGSINGRNVATLATGPGLVNSAGALGAVFASLSPDAVVVTGCGGAFEGSGLSMGDIALATEEIHGQLGVEDEEKPSDVHSLPFLQNRHLLDQEFIEKAFHALQNEQHETYRGIVKGPFLTVATVTSCAETAAGYRNRYGVIMENMEGFAAAALCNQYDIPLLELRAVSNVVGQMDRNTWKLNLAFKRAQEAILHLIEKI